MLAMSSFALQEQDQAVVTDIAGLQWLVFLHGMFVDSTLEAF